ncbi:MAG: exo-beta-N-acetylmuramidase NamZ domain-containing protein [Bacillota bacterium]
MRRVVVLMLIAALMMFQVNQFAQASGPRIKLGNEVLLAKYRHLIEGKRVGLVTHQAGVDSKGRSLIDIFADDPAINLVALYGPEHGIEGTAKAGAYVESTTHPRLGIPVYSLYGPTRKPTAQMLRNIDILVFDMQDIGSRTYTFMSTMNYCMVAAKEHNKPIIVLDRPNPVGGEMVEGPVMEDPYISFVGVDNLPMAHGMTAGELARFFNRKIGADLTVITMEGYTRKMVYQDTGLPWVQTSPNIPDLDSVFGYMATGLGEGTGVAMADKFKWIGGRGLNAERYAEVLNQAGLSGVTFIPENRGESGGVRLNIYDPYTYNPARTGFYALAYAFSLGSFKVPKSSGTNIVMFDKIMGTNKIGQYLEQRLSPQQIEANYAPGLNKFKEERKQYLLYGNEASRGFAVDGQIRVEVEGKPVSFDSPPFIDINHRMMVPIRFIAEALGANVFWNPGTQAVSIIRPGAHIQLTIGSAAAFVNGEERPMDTRPVIKSGRTMVPVRFVAEFMGAGVTWHSQAVTVTID